MYKLEKEALFNKELKIESLEIRLLKLKTNNNKKKVIYIKNAFDNQTFRYRGYNMAQSLEDSNNYIGICFLVSEISYILQYAKNIDLVILQRAHFHNSIISFIKKLKQLSIPIIYDIDDLICNPKYVSLYLKTVHKKYGRGELKDKYLYKLIRFYLASIRYYIIAKKAQGFISTTEFLSEKLRNDFKKPVWTLKNYLNKEQEYHSEIIRKQKKVQKPIKPYYLGYFSGTASHEKDFEVMVDDIEKVMNEYEDINLKIVGYMNLPNNLQNFVKKDRITFVPFVSYEELQYEVGQVDINLIPLLMNDFTNSKSELKYFEASIVNTISCATPTYVFKRIIKNNKNGFICENNWYETIKNIYLNKIDVEGIIQNAYKTAKTEYGSKEQIGQIEEVYDDIIERLKK